MWGSQEHLLGVLCIRPVIHIVVVGHHRLVRRYIALYCCQRYYVDFGRGCHSRQRNHCGEFSMAHVTHETHDMCRQGVKPAKRGRSASTNDVERHEFARLWPWHHCQKNERHRSREDPVKIRFGQDVTFSGSAAAVHSVRDVLRSEKISVSLDFLETYHKYFPKGPSYLGTLRGDR